MSAPEVTCSGCGRKARCIRVSDGTVYRPMAWQYTDPADQLAGLCGDCQAKGKAETFLAMATEMHLADPSRPVADIVDACTEAVLRNSEGEG